MSVRLSQIGKAILAVFLAVQPVAPALAGSLGTAVVPTAVIYPGQEISASQVVEVEVTNPNLVGDYAHRTSEVVGMITKRTLLPGHTIEVSGLRQAFAMTRGSTVRLVFNVGNMRISAAGTPLVDASVGDVIRARNLDSGIIVSGTVMEDGTIQVMPK